MMTIAKKMVRVRNVALMGCTVLVDVGMTATAFAQEAAAPAEGLAEIVVTAQKRAQNIQDVPISITALSQESLQANRVYSVLDLGSVAPSLTVRPGLGALGQAIVSMRGEVGSSSAPGVDKAVSLNLDGVYIGSNFSNGFDLPDLERIEVLRGPQGTLFGRNSTAGAINIVTRDPSGEFRFRQEVTSGNYDQFRSATRVESPAWGPFAASLSYVHDEREGDIKNLGAGTRWDRSASKRQGIQFSPKRLGDKDADSWFAALKFEPFDKFNAVYKFDRTANHFTPEGSGLVVFTPQALGPAAGAYVQSLYDANPAPFGGLDRPKAVNNAWTTPGYQKVYGNNLTMNYEISDHLSLKNIASYRKSYVYANSNLTGIGGLENTDPARGAVGAPVSLSDASVETRAKQWSEEFQVNYDSDFLTLTTGLLYFKLKTALGVPEGLTGAAQNFIPLPGGVIPAGLDHSYNTSISKAGYAQAEVHVTPELDLVGGYRITKDDKSGTTFVRTVPTSFTYEKTKPTYVAGINYKPSNDLLVYGKFSTGFISGGSIAGLDFAPETAASWEGGVKSDLFDQRLRLNLSLFRARYEHLQRANTGRNINRPDLGSIILDQGDATVKGFEAEVTAVPVQGLTLNGGVSYSDFKYTRKNQFFAQLGDFEQWFTPDWTVNLSASYESKPLFNDARLVARLDGNWTSKIGAPGVYLPVRAGYDVLQYSGENWLVNGRLALKGIKAGGGSVEIGLWSRNLLNDDSPQFPLQFGINPYLGSATYIPARTVGVDLIYNY